MAKLLALALAFAALVAFATAHTTIVTTTIEDENPISSRQQCTRQLQGRQLNVCQQYLQQSIQSPYENDNLVYQQSRRLQELCCNQLQNINEQCQCEAVKQVFQDVQHMQGQQGGRFGTQQVGQLRQKAQQLPNQCKLQVGRQCQLGNIRTVITTVEEDNYSRQSSRGSQQCSEVKRRQFSQCQWYIQQQQQQQSGSLLMSISRQGQQQPRELRSCCNELESVQRECQCEAMQEVYKQASWQQQQQQQQGRGQSGRRGVEPQMVQKIVENLQNKCNLQVQQCKIPSAMF